MFDLSQLPVFDVAKQAPSLQQLNQVLHGTVVGNGELTVTGLAHPKHIQSPDQLVVILDEAVITGLLRAGLTIKTALISAKITVPEGLIEGYIQVDRARLALGILLHLFKRPLDTVSGIHPTAIVDPTANIDATASIGPYCVIGANVTIGAETELINQVSVDRNVRIGSDALLYPGVRIAEDCVIGNRVILHHNVSIGADGFSYVTPQASNIETAKATGKNTADRQVQIKIPSVGNVVLEDDVEVGANSTIDRANLGPTLIKRGTKIDNLVMIGHNNTIGEDCLIVSQVGVSGSCEIGNGVTVAGQAGMKDHTKIGDNAIVMAKAGLMRDVGPGEIVVGIPAKPQRQMFQELALIEKLGDMRKELRHLKQEVAALKSAQSSIANASGVNASETPSVVTV